jgi:hypothetical protein
MHWLSARLVCCSGEALSEEKRHKNGKQSSLKKHKKKANRALRRGRRRGKQKR